MSQETKVEIKLDKDKTPMIKLDNTPFEKTFKIFLREHDSFARKRKAVKTLLYLNFILFICLVFMLSLSIYLLFGGRA